VVAEQRREAEVCLAVERAPPIRGGPPGPGGGIDRMSRRAEREDIEDHGLVVAAPVVGEEACPRFRMPAKGNNRRPWGEPLPVDAGVDRVGEPADGGFAGIGGVVE